MFIDALLLRIDGLLRHDCVFPDIRKTARVTPIFQSRRLSDLNNYRQISVLSAVSRIFEKVAQDQLFFISK